MKLDDFLAKVYGDHPREDVLELNLCLVDDDVCVGEESYPIGKLKITTSTNKKETIQTPLLRLFLSAEELAKRGIGGTEEVGRPAR